MGKESKFPSPLWDPSVCDQLWAAASTTAPSPQPTAAPKERGSVINPVTCPLPCSPLAATPLLLPPLPQQIPSKLKFQSPSLGDPAVLGSVGTWGCSRNGGDTG